MQRKRIADASKGVGRPKVGGTFELVDQNGKPFTSEMMKGKYSLVCCLSTSGFTTLTSSCATYDEEQLV